jgi:hypothetical protein
MTRLTILALNPLAAARTELRRLLADGKTLDVGKGTEPVQKSPHARANYDAAEFDVLKDKYEQLKWRMISKPGGATVKPDDFYR